MPTASRAVFLSYASEDAPAAQRIADALRAAGIEVWFDQSELRGGDAWDRQIRKQIHDCGLFVPIISKHTHERAEGYFRLEWKLAVDRSHLIMANKAFLGPVFIDETADDECLIVHQSDGGDRIARRYLRDAVQYPGEAVERGMQGERYKVARVNDRRNIERNTGLERL